MEDNQKTRHKRYLVGTVTSDKMDKTRVITVKWAKKHRKYHKIVRMTSKYKAHDPENKTKVGDEVRIMEIRPISKDKRWLILEKVSGGK